MQWLLICAVFLFTAGRPAVLHILLGAIASGVGRLRSFSDDGGFIPMVLPHFVLYVIERFDMAVVLEIGYSQPLLSTG